MLTSLEKLGAEGLAAESYLECGDRGSFANHDGAIALHPAWGTVGANELALLWEAKGCAPLCLGGPVVERARAHLAGRRRRLNYYLVG